jgi:multiple sugar transport system permease protein
MTAQPTSSNNFKPGFDFWRVGVIVIMLGGVIIVLFPIIWMVFASMRPTQETLSSPPVWLPQEITFSAYTDLLADPRQLRYFTNTYIIALSTAGLSVGLGALAAYGFSRFRIRGARVILLAILSIQMMPNVSLIIPFFNMSLALNIHNTHLALILADTAFALPIAIWLLKGFLDSIPTDLEEAAMVDGCSRLGALRRIVLPLALPGLIGTGVFAFLYAWNEFLFAVVLTAGPDVAPLTIAISQFFTQFGREWNAIMALNVIASLPLLIFFIFMQRWVVQGLTAGAVK